MPNRIVYDCEEARLSPDERAFFRDSDPWGFILFGRHCENPEQMRALCGELRESVGRDAPIMIDQEGGRVARMRSSGAIDTIIDPQHTGAQNAWAQNTGAQIAVASSDNNLWPDYPPMGAFGELWRLSPEKARDAAWLNAFLLGRMITDCGVNINAIPMLDVRQPDSDPVTIGDRALAHHGDIITALGHEVIEGLGHGGALSIIKHLPGLGRALCDSHKELPQVHASKVELKEIDFAPFQSLQTAPMGMTGHVLFPKIDPEFCSTWSKIIIHDIIRDEIGFDGLLFSDDLKMEALGGDYPDRAEKALQAGCDIGLACNFDLKQKIAIANKVPPMEGKVSERAEKALNWKPLGKVKELETTYECLLDLMKPVWTPKRHLTA